MEKHSQLISTKQLYSLLHSTDLVILDCRFDLLDPHWGNDQFNQSHIPGAIFVDLNHDLSGPIVPSSGRHPLPDRDTFINQLHFWGITHQKQVVSYDANYGGFASRVWWLTRMYGFENTAILDGGWQKWIAESLPTTSLPTCPTPAPLSNLMYDPSFFVDVETMIEAIDDPKRIIIDVRNPDRYRGENEPIDPIAGHIPTAVNRPIAVNLNEDGTFKDPEQLRNELLNLLGSHASENAIIYCGSGVTSCHLALAMALAELPGAKIYAGSWSEWIRDPKRPIELGQGQS